MLQVRAARNAQCHSLQPQVSMATKKRGAAANGGTGAELAGQLQQGSQAPGEGSDRASVGPPKSPKPFVNARAAAFEGLLDITG